ncbi:carbohydrate ABC transporter permease [Cryobacterium levicorallinum]|uniref:Carbohydrate ABC transporter permease n=1 Tax=Cryobacterium levicorallinum TaxID=995038 RepID=A0A1I3CYL3_9MICO|nr:carbohydrate ABC transporter permease [Cryobacterium levicorallinum]TFB78621.1 carbohydrate ABC transporter permease [Cryobacterium levicorallinum]GEP27927.1 sugar ABC transporter permease [Cryobacterium levicorallinum]SFH79478.1 raffinose/stachyose/melibiose transport system permease protein [Cryobacterium levicorallinum]
MKSSPFSLDRLNRVWINGVLIALAVLFLAPLIYIFLNSFKAADEIFLVPQSILPLNWTLENYAAALSGGFVGYFTNSVVITVGGVALTVILSSLAGYGFAKLPFRGVNFILLVIVATLTVPLVIFLVPMFLMENAVGLLDTNLGLILPNVAVSLPFAILIMRASFGAIPQEIEESAVMDGAGVMRRWWTIMLPMARNGMVLVVIMTTYSIWGEYTMAKTLAMDPGAMPLSVGLTLLKGEVWQYGVLAAVIVLAVLPPVVIFIIFQRHIVAGVAQGAVKG